MQYPSLHTIEIIKTRQFPFYTGRLQMHRSLMPQYPVIMIYIRQEQADSPSSFAPLHKVLKILLEGFRIGIAQSS